MGKKRSIQKNFSLHLKWEKSEFPLFLFNQWILSQTDLESLYSKKLDMTAEMNILVSASLYNLVSSLVQMVLQPLASIAIVAGVVNIIQEQKSKLKNFLLKQRNNV